MLATGNSCCLTCINARLSRVSSSHATTDIIKTDAPLSVIWDILRAYVKSKTDDLNLGKVDEQHVKRKILTDVQGDTKISFELAEDRGLKAIKNAIRSVES